MESQSHNLRLRIVAALTPYTIPPYNPLVKNISDDIRAVLFDLDGTLVDTNIDFTRMKEDTLRLAERYGLTRTELADRDVLGIVEMAHRLLAVSGRHDEALAFSADAEALLEKIELRHAKRTQTIDGAAELLAALSQAHIKSGVVTRNCRAAAYLSLQIARLACDVVLTRSDVEDRKPNPNHLLAALDRLGVDPSNALMVGDHTMDIQAGKAAGMRTIGFLRPGHPRDFFDPVSPDAVIISLQELLDALINLHS